MAPLLFFPPGAPGRDPGLMLWKRLWRKAESFFYTKRTFPFFFKSRP